MKKKNIDYEVLMEMVAASVFTDVHHGRAISEKELKVLQELLNIYNLEIKQAKEIISNEVQFNKMKYNDQVTYVVHLLNKLRIKNQGTSEIPDIHIPDEDNEWYADVDDVLSDIPQEPYQPLPPFESKKSK